MFCVLRDLPVDMTAAPGGGRGVTTTTTKTTKTGN